jgi:hypothetical protein
VDLEREAITIKDFLRIIKPQIAADPGFENLPIQITYWDSDNQVDIQHDANYIRLELGPNGAVVFGRIGD